MRSGPKKHRAICHGVGGCARGAVRTGGTEPFRAPLRRGYCGTCHRMSDNHPHRFVSEFASRPSGLSGRRRRDDRTGRGAWREMGSRAPGSWPRGVRAVAARNRSGSLICRPRLQNGRSPSGGHCSGAGRSATQAWVLQRAMSTAPNFCQSLIWLILSVFDIQAHIRRARDVPGVGEHHPRDTAQGGPVQQMEGRIDSAWAGEKRAAHDMRAMPSHGRSRDGMRARLGHGI